MAAKTFIDLNEKRKYTGQYPQDPKTGFREILESSDLGRESVISLIREAIDNKHLDPQKLFTADNKLTSPMFFAMEMGWGWTVVQELVGKNPTSDIINWAMSSSLQKIHVSKEDLCPHKNSLVNRKIILDILEDRRPGDSILIQTTPIFERLSYLAVDSKTDIRTPTFDRYLGEGSKNIILPNFGLSYLIFDVFDVETFKHYCGLKRGKHRALQRTRPTAKDSYKQELSSVLGSDCMCHLTAFTKLFPLVGVIRPLSGEEFEILNNVEKRRTGYKNKIKDQHSPSLERLLVEDVENDLLETYMNDLIKLVQYISPKWSEDLKPMLELLWGIVEKKEDGTAVPLDNFIEELRKQYTSSVSNAAPYQTFIALFLSCIAFGRCGEGEGDIRMYINSLSDVKGVVSVKIASKHIDRMLEIIDEFRKKLGCIYHINQLNEIENYVRT